MDPTVGDWKQQQLVADLTTDLLDIAATLNYFNEYVKPLKKIRSLAENEPYIADLVLRIRNIFVREGYVNEEFVPRASCHLQLRKVVLCLMLNTDVQLKFDLSEDPAVSHLIQLIAPLTRCVLYAIVWQLHLEQPFAEILKHSPYWFTSQYLVDIAESVKYSEPYARLGHLSTLIEVIYTNTARSEFHSCIPIDRMLAAEKMFNVLAELIHFIYTPDAVMTHPKRKFYKYIGHVMMHNLRFVQNCFELYLKRPRLGADAADLHMFRFMDHREPIKDDGQATYNERVAKSLDRINVVLLNALQNNVKLIDLHAYTYWTEINLSEFMTMQSGVGELADAVTTLITGHKCFEHEVGAQLQLIAVKPKSAADMASGSSIGQLIEMLESLSKADLDTAKARDTLAAYLDEYIGRGVLVLNNDECLQTLQVHVGRLSVDQVKRLIDFAVSFAKGGADAECMLEERLIEIVATSLGNFEAADVLDLTAYSMANRTAHADLFEMDYFPLALTEIFNRSNVAECLAGFCKLLFQNPGKFYDKCFTDALSSEPQMYNALAVLEATRPVFEPLAPAYVDKVVEWPASTEAEERKLPIVLGHLFRLRMLEPKVFIVDTLYARHLIGALKATDYDRIQRIVATLQEICKFTDFADMRPVLLAAMPAVLELCRWDLTTFTDQLADILAKTIDVTARIIDVFMAVVNRSDIFWIVRHYQRTSKYTRYYYQKLDWANAPLDFVAFHMRDGNVANGPASVKEFVCAYLVRCTDTEIGLLVGDPLTMPHIWKSLKWIADVVKRSRHPKQQLCLKYIATAVVRAVEAKYLALPGLSQDDRVGHLSEIGAIVRKMEGMALCSEFLSNLQPLLVTHIDRCDAEAKQRLVDTFDKLAASDARAMIMLKLNASGS